VPIRIHYHPLSTFSQRVRITLAEKQIAPTEYELVEVDFPGREHKGEAFLAKNPYGRVPAIEHDDFVLFESTAILEYLEALWPTPALVPSEPRARATMAMHMKLCDLEFGSRTGALVFPTRFLPRERWKLEPMQEARAGIERHLQNTDGMLGERTWLLGDQFTLAEVCYAPLVRFLDEIEVNGTPRIRAWTDRVLARPSVRETWLPR
jgi:glutathione S-transferase